jgi:hypothetical protein
MKFLMQFFLYPPVNSVLCMERMTTLNLKVAGKALDTKLYSLN